MIRTCGNCLYFVSFSSKHGTCNANPPENLLSYISSNDQKRKEFHYRSGRPATCMNDVACSKYVPKDNAVNVVAEIKGDAVRLIATDRYENEAFISE